MASTYLPRTLIRGNTRRVDITVRDVRRQPIDLSGCTVYFTMNQSPNPADDTSASLQKAITAHTDPVQGRTSALLTHADTKDLALGTHYFDALVVDAFGQVVSKQQGQITVIANITHKPS